MPYKKLLLLFAFFTISLYAFADAMPKGYQKYSFNTQAKVDSVMIQESDDIRFSTFDTLKSHHHLDFMYCQDKVCRYVGSCYKKYQRLVIFSGGKITFVVYKPVGSNPTFVVTEQNGMYTITETTGFLFRGKLGEILRALLITLFLELLVGLLMLRGHISPKTLRFVVLANCISLPIAWLGFDFLINYFGSAALLLIAALEALIFFFEFVFLRYFLPEISRDKLFSYSLTANVVSFFVGGFLYLVTTFF